MQKKKKLLNIPSKGLNERKQQKERMPKGWV